jgi:hypothetical protein
MPLSKEQAESAFDIATAPARQERARQELLREQKRLQVMPLRWRLWAVLAGTTIGATVYWLVPKPMFAWVPAICIIFSVNFAQFIWRKRVKA